MGPKKSRGESSGESSGYLLFLSFDIACNIVGKACMVSGFSSSLAQFFLGGDGPPEIRIRHICSTGGNGTIFGSFKQY